MAEPHADLSPESVLIAEDEALVAIFLADLVEDLGWDVIGPVANQTDALGAAKERRPAAAIVDVNLGGEDGIGCAPRMGPPSFFFPAMPT